MKDSSTRRYKGVFKDSKGHFFFQTELGIDPVTGKRIQKKGRKNKIGKQFESAKEAYDEMIQVKAEFNRLYSHDNYNMTFEQYMALSTGIQTESSSNNISDCSNSS